ncbi:MAG TPA: twin-arginine translocase subunit TatC [Pseudobdellovibrionaceae bacterium]|nr:twin-arginine translocase subunit TatC [Pseudobdellovibrionaceae bacterium]
MTNPEENHQAFTEHLVELRTRIIHSLYAILIGTILCWSISEHIFALIKQPIISYLPEQGLIYTGPLDKFMTFLKLSFFSGVAISCPFWLYQIWKFVAPGLYSHEKKYSIGFIGFGTVMFFLGILFSYFVVLPMAFKFLMTFGGDADKPMIAIDRYLSFVSEIILMFGVAFELPLVLVTLGLMGVIDVQFLKEKRRYAIVGISILCAIITPPDAISMVLMMIPMILLYELSIVILKFMKPLPTNISST